MESTELRATQHELPNGITVLAVEQPCTEAASVQVWCQTGSIHEGNWAGAGLSHLLEPRRHVGRTLVTLLLRDLDVAQLVGELLLPPQVRLLGLVQLLRHGFDQPLGLRHPSRTRPAPARRDPAPHPCSSGRHRR